MRQRDVGAAEVGADHPGEGGFTDERRPRIAERPLLPSGRATLGALLLALSGLGTFLAWQQAAGQPDRSYVVADRAISPGQRLTEADVRLVPIELPARVAERSFVDAESVLGRVALGPVGQGELVQTAQLSEARAVEPVDEVAFSLARDRAVDGHLRSGDRVDVFVTYPDHTTLVADDVQVVTAGEGSASSLASGAPLTVTLALAADHSRAALIHAMRAGEVTLVRSTHAAPASADGADAAPTAPADETFPPGGAGSGGS